MVKLISQVKENIKEGKNIYIYGAGVYGKAVYQYLRTNDICVSGYVVSDITNSKNDVVDACICEVDTFFEDYSHNSENTVILIAMKNSQQDVIEMLSKKNFYNYYALSYEQLRDIFERVWLQQFSLTIKKLQESKQKNIELRQFDSLVEQEHAIIIDKANRYPLYRVSLCVDKSTVLDGIVAFCNQETFCKQFGKLKYVGKDKSDEIQIPNGKEKEIQIYKVTSGNNRDKKLNQRQEYLTEIYVGDGLSGTSELTDNIGDNISNRNRDYSEATALYWIWKNTSGQEYVGLCHYRRWFIVTELMYKELVTQKADVIITLPQFVQMPVKDFFTYRVREQDWKLLEQYVCQVDESYAETFHRYEQSHFYIPCNMAIMKRRLFDEYCEFAFSVTEKIYQYYKNHAVIRGDRYMGYIFENLLSIFIMNKKGNINVDYTDMRFIK